MPSNSAQQTAQAQQGQQNQAEQFLAQQRQLAEKQWANFFSQNPNPASQWGRLQAPSFAGMPSTIGGGTIGGPSGGTLQGATGGSGGGWGGMFTPQQIEQIFKQGAAGVPHNNELLGSKPLGPTIPVGGGGTVQGTPKRPG